METALLNGEESEFVMVPPLKMKRFIGWNADVRRKKAAESNPQGGFDFGVLPEAKLHDAEAYPLDGHREFASEVSSAAKLQTAEAESNPQGGVDFGVLPEAKLHDTEAESAAWSFATGKTPDATPQSGVATPSRMGNVFKTIFFVCVIFLGGELAWLFLVTPLRPLSSVTVTGIAAGLMDRDAALKKAGIGPDTSYLSFDAKSAERNLCAVPLIESAKVVKYFPGTVRITLVPRKSVALFLQNGNQNENANGRAVPVYFDKHGVVFKIGGARDAFLSVPVVSGFEADRIEEGGRLANAYIPLFENLDKLAASAPGLYQAISEIHINQKTYDGFDVTLFPSHSPVKIRMSADLDEETVGRMFLLVDALEAKGEEVSEIDFRSGTASYIVKGTSQN
ncbi:MAG: FtsQ-type POTRA domain-containing protein [Spirochaetaceae bacterium]|jgi:cell division protein FtsQ|nr:FtsQ-type POTRA domain-containing protein [Spirochaetaceae bacterium]